MRGRLRRPLFVPALSYRLSTKSCQLFYVVYITLFIYNVGNAFLAYLNRNETLHIHIRRLSSIVCRVRLFIATPIFNFAYAATALPASSSSVAIEVIPEVPGPFERATLVLTSYAADLDRSLVVWSVNGKEIQRGIGKKSFSFILGGVGSVSVVRVDVQTSTLGTITNTLTFNPGYVDILWEASDSYVPPFYKGKALPSSQANMRLTAVPTMLSANGNLFRSGVARVQLEAGFQIQRVLRSIRFRQTIGNISKKYVVERRIYPGGSIVAFRKRRRAGRNIRRPIFSAGSLVPRRPAYGH